MSDESGNQGEEGEEEEIMPPPPIEGEMPTYFHVGGWAKECLIKGYKIGVWHIDSTSVVDTLALSSYGEAKPDWKTVVGGMELRKQINGEVQGALGWATTKQVSAELTAKTGNLLSSLLLTYGMADDGGLAVLCKQAYERTSWKVELIVPMIKEPMMLGYVLLKPAEHWLLGYRMVYNFDAGGFDKHAICLGFNNGRTEIGLKLENFEDFRYSFFRRIGELWAFALKMNIYAKEDTKWAIGVQRKIGEDALLKAKLREDGQVGVVFQQKMSDSIAISYHFGLEGNSPLQGQHKIGVAWSLNC